MRPFDAAKQAPVCGDTNRSRNSSRWGGVEIYHYRAGAALYLPQIRAVAGKHTGPAPPSGPNCQHSVMLKHPEAGGSAGGAGASGWCLHGLIPGGWGVLQRMPVPLTKVAPRGRTAPPQRGRKQGHVAFVV